MTFDSEAVAENSTTDALPHETPTPAEILQGIEDQIGRLADAMELFISYLDSLTFRPNTARKGEDVLVLRTFDESRFD